MYKLKLIKNRFINELHLFKAKAKFTSDTVDRCRVFIKQMHHFTLQWVSTDGTFVFSLVSLKAICVLWSGAYFNKQVCPHRLGG